MSHVLYRLLLFPVTLGDLNYHKLPHFDILHRLSYLRSKLDRDFKCGR